jgi:hypothetical protein
MACTQMGTNDQACPQCGHPYFHEGRSLDHIYNTRMHEQASPLYVNPEHPDSVVGRSKKRFKKEADLLID